MLNWLPILFLGFLLKISSAEVTVIIGGEVDGLLEIPTSAIETYSPDCGLFDAGLPPIPVARKLLGATYLDGFIYICGGYNLILSVKECYKLNLSNTTQGWVPIAPLIKGRFNFKMVSANGFIYAVGGEGPFSEHDDIEVYDPATDTWSDFVTFTGFRLSFCAVVSETEEELYLVGGVDGNGLKRRLESLNLQTKEWKRLPDMLENRTSCGCGIYGNSLIAVGGWGHAGPNGGVISAVKTAEFFDFQEGKWLEFPSMHARRTEFFLGVYPDRQLVTAFGGYQGAHINTIEEFDGESDWDFLAQDLKEPKSEMAGVTVPDGIIVENC